MGSNVQKMREALEMMISLFDKGVICTSYANTPEEMEQIDELYRKAKSALALPLRNCDVGTAEEQAQRYDKFCEEMDCVKCPVRDLWHHYFDICKNRKVSCGLIWAQMPYEAYEEGAGK